MLGALAAIAADMRVMVLRGARRPFDRSDGRAMKRDLAATIGACAAAGLFIAEGASGASWDERVFPEGSHLDFDAVAAAGPSALPALIQRGRQLFKAKFNHRRRRRAADGDAGNHPNQAQERR